MATDFNIRSAILAELWMNFRDDANLQDFFEYNDLGLPLAYVINTELAIPTETGKIYVNETFDLLCAAIGVDPEGDYTTLNEMFSKGIQE